MARSESYLNTISKLVLVEKNLPFTEENIEMAKEAIENNKVGEIESGGGGGGGSQTLVVKASDFKETANFYGPMGLAKVNSMDWYEKIGSVKFEFEGSEFAFQDSDFQVMNGEEMGFEPGTTIWVYNAAYEGMAPDGIRPLMSMVMIYGNVLMDKEFFEGEQDESSLAKYVQYAPGKMTVFATIMYLENPEDENSMAQINPDKLIFSEAGYDDGFKKGFGKDFCLTQSVIDSLDKITSYAFAGMEGDYDNTEPVIIPVDKFSGTPRFLFRDFRSGNSRIEFQLSSSNGYKNSYIFSESNFENSYLDRGLYIPRLLDDGSSHYINRNCFREAYCSDSSSKTPLWVKFNMIGENAFNNCRVFSSVNSDEEGVWKMIFDFDRELNLSHINNSTIKKLILENNSSLNVDVDPGWDLSYVRCYSLSGGLTDPYAGGNHLKFKDGTNITLTSTDMERNLSRYIANISSSYIYVDPNLVSEYQDYYNTDTVYSWNFDSYYNDPNYNI